jgi:hypothetical protein
MLYYPYPANDGKHKFYIFNSTGRKIYFGDIRYENYTTHKDPERKRLYISRHVKREDWTNPDKAGYWSYKYLWLYPTKAEAYKHIKQDLKNRGYIN